MDYKKLCIKCPSKRKPSMLSPWQNEEENNQCEPLDQKEKDSFRSKSCTQDQFNISPIELVKPVPNISVKRSLKCGLEGRRRYRGKPKFSSICQTIDSNHNIREKQTLKRKNHCRLFTQEQHQVCKSPQAPSRKSQSPPLVIPVAPRYSTVAVEDVDRSLRTTLKIFRDTMIQQNTSKVLTTSSVNTKHLNNQKVSKKFRLPEKATIIMPTLGMIDVPKQFNPYSFSFFRNTKFTQSCTRQPKKRIQSFRSMLPHLYIN